MIENSNRNTSSEGCVDLHLLLSQELVTELHMQSIFTDVGKLSLQDPSHSVVLPSSVGHTGSPITSTAWLSHSGEAHYALASPAGGIMVVTLPPHNTEGKDRFTEEAASCGHRVDCKTARVYACLQAACRSWS